MTARKIPRSIGTHDGTFHADEVTACALLLLFDLADEEKIIRTRDTMQLQECEFVCDVGGEYNPDKKLFDHHQADYTGTLSSAGMILRYLFDSKKIKQQEYDFFNQSLILGVDAHDNGADLQLPGVCTYSLVVANFTPIIHDVSLETLDGAFHKALDFALGHLKRLWKRYHYVMSCQQIVLDTMASRQTYLYFDRGIPWMDSFFAQDGEHHPAMFVIMPSGSHWKLRGIPPNMNERMKVRLPLPLLWAGLSDEELQNVTGIPGAIFCHKGRFISVWETKEDALKALELTLKLSKGEK